MNPNIDTTAEEAESSATRNAPSSEQPAIESPVVRQLSWPIVRSKSLRLIRNPLFLVIVTWAVMAMLLYFEIVGR